MEHAKKMALVDPKLLESLKSPPHYTQPRLRVLSSLDEEMKEVLSDSNPSPEEKVKRYNQILQRFLTHHDQHVKALLPPTPTQAPTQKLTENESTSMEQLDRELLDSVPVSLRNKAALVLQRAKNNPRLSWNESGELSHNGSKVPGSNLVDLVNDFVRERKNSQPIGWDVFAKSLKEANIPAELVGNKERWRWMQEATRETPPPTPHKPQTPTGRRRPKKKVWRWSAY